MSRNPMEAQRLFEEQLCDSWRRDDFTAWAKGVGFIAPLLGHKQLRDDLKWLVNVRVLKVEEGNWHELPTR